MAAYIFKRLLLMVPTLFGVLLMTFVVIQFVPGGPVEQMVSQLQGRDSGGEGAPVSGAGYRGRQGVDAERIAEIRALYGSDKPPVERFTQMLWQFAQFDLGKSFFYPKDVWTLVKEKLPVSISLGLWTFLLSYAISIPLGVAKAVRAGSRFDMVSSLVVLAGYAIPGFVLGVALLVVFGGQLQMFPLRGLTSANWDQLAWPARITDYLWHIALPVTASVGLVCSHHHVDQKRHAGRNTQTVCVDRTRQRFVGATGDLAPCVSQCIDTVGDWFSGSVCGCVFHRLVVD